MRFETLLENANVPLRDLRGDAEITSVATDSRRCADGTCFVAVRGCGVDGHEYIPSAVTAGASAVVCEDASRVPDGVAWAVVDDTRRAVGPLAQAAWGFPARRLTALGVTGTNGKSTVAWLVHAILAHAGHRPALLGTIHHQTGGRTLAAANTTPGPVELAEMTAEMVADGRTHLVMEVSSHALDQRRTDGMAFRAGVFTNLTGDHLDYHGTMEAYRAAKLRLFESLAPTAAAIVNRDDDAAEAFASASGAPVTFYGLGDGADVRGRVLEAGVDGTRFELTSPAGVATVHTPLIGGHNVSNCLAAAATALAVGVDLTAVAEALEGVGTIPGRLQRVQVDAPYRVFVDYAHTDDALKNVLGALRPIRRKRTILVFGCGGDRDRTKRPRMARVAADRRHGADKIIVTSDNPRSEDPRSIIEDIVAGFDGTDRPEVLVEPDRKAAIRMAIGQAEANDVVLIAGKGHEDYQIIGAEKVHFDDVEVAAEAMRTRGACV